MFVDICVRSLDEARDRLAVDSGAPDDLVVVRPHTSLVAGDEHAAATYELFDGAVVVAAAPDGDGWRPLPQVVCGPRAVLGRSLVEAGSRDAPVTGDALLDALVASGCDVVLDAGRQFFHVVDGTGTDVVAVAGAFHAGPERPAVVVATDQGALGALAALRRELENPGSDDLAALLRYDGAVAVGDAPTVVAPEIVQLPFWTESFCGTVIRAAEVAGVWAADPDDPVPGAEVSLLAISPRLAALVDEDLQRRVWPALQAVWPQVAPTPMSDAFVIRTVAGPAGDVGSALPLHHDIAQVSASVRLNTGYEGGDLSFPRQGWDTRHAPVGALTAWPSLVTHPHAVTPVTRGARYGLTIWFALPG